VTFNMQEIQIVSVNELTDLMVTKCTMTLIQYLMRNIEGFNDTKSFPHYP
jgi:hypothetical protein